MSDGVGLSVGATNLAGVVVGRAALLRSPVLTRYPHRPPEVGVPSENPRLNERGLILTDFVDRVGDPVGIVAADGTSHRADVVLADALRAMLYGLGGGRVPPGPVAVTHPAHWRSAAVDALRTALAGVPEFQAAPVFSDATAALTALRDDPGLPARGVIALCDFGGSGTSITLVDAADNYTPVAPTVRHSDFSGDLVDQALLTHVIEDLSAAGVIDLSGTSAIGALGRLRAQCRGAKERLSTDSVTTLMAELPGHRSEVRVTRNELDEAIRWPLAGFITVLQDSLDRNGIHRANLAAVASAGGGARIPLITTALSEHFRVPVITTGRPALTAAIGGGLAAVRGTVEEGATSISPAPEVAAAAAAATALAPEAAPAEDVAQPGAVGALAWSDAEDIPEVPTADPYDYPVVPGRSAEPRPQLQFDHESWDDLPPPPLPWYRKPAVALGVGVIAVLAALTAALLFVVGDDDTTSPASTTEPITATPRSTTPPPTSEPPAPQPPPPPPPRTVTRQPPPPVTQTVTVPPPSPEPEPPPPSPSPEPPPPSPSPEPPPPTSEPPPTTEPPPWSPTPPYPTIPGLPWVPAPQFPQPG